MKGERDLVGLEFNSIEDALVVLHGVPRAAAEVAVKNMGSPVSYETEADGGIQVHVGSEKRKSFSTKFRELLSTLGIRTAS